MVKAALCGTGGTGSVSGINEVGIDDIDIADSSILAIADSSILAIDVYDSSILAIGINDNNNGAAIQAPWSRSVVFACLPLKRSGRPPAKQSPSARAAH
ncbi:MAG: hypothetical protein JWR21_4431 [Herminiimonas sp.]|nr:hypothetical protein [Herminiimonas sp.]MDB5856028.1 hypothetical protein [Herminiimonas sp.]